MSEDALLAARPTLDVIEGRLAELAGKPVADHVAVYEDVHAALQQTLAVLDED